MIDLFHQHFDLRPEPAFSYGAASGVRPLPGLVGYAKRSAVKEKATDDRLIGFVPPTSGMFVCVSSASPVRSNRRSDDDAQLGPRLRASASFLP